MKKIILPVLLIGISLCFSSCAQKSYEEKITSMNEQEQMKAIKQNSYGIRFIKNPSEAMQLEAVRQDGKSIEYIKNPSESIQLEAIKQDFNSIKYIKNPSEAVQLEAVKQFGELVIYIKNPSEAIQLVAVKQNGSLIGLFNNPSENVKLEAVKQSGYAIKNIKNPSEKLKLEASKSIKSLDEYTTTKIKDFTLADKNIKIEVLDNNSYSVTNLTTQFIRIKTVSFYYGKIVSSLEDISLPPKSSQKIPFPNSSLKYGPDVNNIDFGFAVNYYLNEKSLDLYKVQQYPLVEFLYKR